MFWLALLVFHYDCEDGMTIWREETPNARNILDFKKEAVTKHTLAPMMVLGPPYFWLNSRP